MKITIDDLSIFSTENDLYINTQAKNVYINNAKVTNISFFEKALNFPKEINSTLKDFLISNFDDFDYSSSEDEQKILFEINYLNSHLCITINKRTQNYSIDFGHVPSLKYVSSLKNEYDVESILLELEYKLEELTTLFSENNVEYKYLLSRNERNHFIYAYFPIEQFNLELINNALRLIESYRETQDSMYNN